MRGKLAAVVSLAALAGTALAGCTGGVTVPQSVAGESVEVSNNGLPMTLGLTYVPNAQFAPVYVAAADSIFTSAGLGVSVRHHGTDEGLFSALIAGDEDVVIATGDEVLQARSAGADLVAIGQYYNEYPVEVMVPAESDIETIADLKGKKVGLPGEFGSNWFGLLAALEEAGMDRGEIQVVSVGYTQTAALAAGDVDAIVGFSNSDAVQLDRLGVEARSIPLGTNIPLVGATVVTTEKWLAENGRSAEQLLSSLAAAMEKVAANPMYALEVTAEWDDTLSDPAALAGAKATLEATIPLWTVDGKADMTQDLKKWQQMGPFMAKILDEPAILEAADGAVTNQYAVR